MSSPSRFLGLALIAAAGLFFSACKGGPERAPAPADDQQALAAEAQTAPASSATVGRRPALQRVGKKERPMVERVQRIAPLLTDGGAPNPMPKLNCGPRELKPIKTMKAEDNP